jgi:hypothetical protein
MYPAYEIPNWYLKKISYLICVNYNLTSHFVIAGLQVLFTAFFLRSQLGASKEGLLCQPIPDFGAVVVQPGELAACVN